jgi:hypothetical protein
MIQSKDLFVREHILFKSIFLDQRLDLQSLMKVTILEEFQSCASLTLIHAHAAVSRAHVLHIISFLMVCTLLDRPLERKQALLIQVFSAASAISWTISPFRSWCLKTQLDFNVRFKTYQPKIMLWYLLMSVSTSMSVAVSLAKTTKKSKYGLTMLKNSFTISVQTGLKSYFNKNVKKESEIL